jgi:hypothetical protein
MKTTLTTSAKILLKAWDIELKALLEQDLAAYKARKKQSINQGAVKQAA